MSDVHDYLDRLDARCVHGDQMPPLFRNSRRFDVADVLGQRRKRSSIGMARLPTTTRRREGTFRCPQPLCDKPLALTPLDALNTETP